MLRLDISMNILCQCMFVDGVAALGLFAYPEMSGQKSEVINSRFANQRISSLRHVWGIPYIEDNVMTILGKRRLK